MNSVTIEFYTDFICPWCYIGKERMTKIVDSLKDQIDITLIPKPYLLYPTIPIGGVDKSVFAKKTKSGMGRSLKNEAAIEQIELNYRKIERIPNSRIAHKLISTLPDYKLKWSRSLEIIRDYFQQGQNIEDEQYLKAKLECDHNLHDTQYEDQLKEELEEAEELNISLVPTIRLNKAIVMPGLHTTEVWTRYIQRASVMKL